MSTITSTITHGVTLSGTGSYNSPLTITASGYVNNSGTGNAVYGGFFGAGYTVDNYGKILATGTFDGIKLLGGAHIVNGKTGATTASVTGSNGIYVSENAGSIANYGTITGTGTSGNFGYGVILRAGGAIINGASNSTAALISGHQEGISGANTVTNFATIVGTAAYGIFVSGGATIDNTGTAALISGRKGIETTGTATVVNQGSIKGGSGDGIYILSTGFVTNGVSGGTIGSITGYTGVYVESGSVTNYGTITGNGFSGDGVEIGFSGGNIGNFGTAGMISGNTGVSSQNAGTVVNSGTITGTGAAGASLGKGSILINGPSGATKALISSAGQGVGISGGGTVANYGTIVSTSTVIHEGVDLSAGGLVVNGAAGSTAGLISGYAAGVLISGTVPGTVVNFGTIVATRTTGDGVNLQPGGTIVDSGTILNGVNLGGTGSNLLELQRGYKITGSVYGAAAAANTLQLSGALGTLTVTYSTLSPINFKDVLFTGDGTEILKLSSTSGTFPLTLSDFITNTETIDLTALGTNGTIRGTANSQLTIVGSGGTVTLKLDGSDGSVFTTHSDGGTGTDVVACFCRGTRILTREGEVAVEDLAIGDKVTIASGALRPVKWIGRRSYDGRFVRGNAEVLPIRVRAGALGEGVPRRDLYLSPKHALHLDGVLVPAELLVNGASVERVAAPDRIDYFHIELDDHDLILAEGAAAESYVDCDNRGMFHNAAEFAGLYPGKAPERWTFCAERVEAGEKLSAVRARLAARLPRLGWAMTDDPGLHLLVDGRVLWPEVAGGGLHIFRVPGPAREVRLASRAAAPAESGLGDDRRRLGVGLRRLVLRNDSLRITLGFADPSLSEGFYAPEADHRWTDGDARLPQRLLECFEGAVIVEIEAGALESYPVLAEPASATGTDG